MARIKGKFLKVWNAIDVEPFSFGPFVDIIERDKSYYGVNAKKEETFLGKHESPFFNTPNKSFSFFQITEVW